MEEKNTRYVEMWKKINDNSITTRNQVIEDIEYLFDGKSLQKVMRMSSREVAEKYGIKPSYASSLIHLVRYLYHEGEIVSISQKLVNRFCK